MKRNQNSVRQVRITNAAAVALDDYIARYLKENEFRIYPRNFVSQAILEAISIAEKTAFKPTKK